MLGRVVDLKPIGQALCLCGWERLVERGRRVILPRLCGVLAGLGDYASAMVISIAVS